MTVIAPLSLKPPCVVSMEELTKPSQQIFPGWTIHLYQINKKGERGEIQLNDQTITLIKKLFEKAQIDLERVDKFTLTFDKSEQEPHFPLKQISYCNPKERERSMTLTGPYRYLDLTRLFYRQYWQDVQYQADKLSENLQKLHEDLGKTAPAIRPAARSDS